MLMGTWLGMTRWWRGRWRLMCRSAERWWGWGECTGYWYVGCWNSCVLCLFLIFVVVCCRVLRVGIVGLVRCRAKVVYYEHCISLRILDGPVVFLFIECKNASFYGWNKNGFGLKRRGDNESCDVTIKKPQLQLDGYESPLYISGLIFPNSYPTE